MILRQRHTDLISREILGQFSTHKTNQAEIALFPSLLIILAIVTHLRRDYSTWSILRGRKNETRTWPALSKV